MKQINRQILDFAETVWLNKGRAYFVGGTVRDRLLGVDVKDIDIEVHGVEPRALRTIVESHFKDVQEMGAAFGVLSTRIKVDSKTTPNPSLAGGEFLGVDISLPREDSKVGAGHKGFDVNVDPNLSIEEALLRRDFTINAMLEDILDGTIHDPYGGRADLNARKLRVVDESKFGEDPLRVLRGVQLAGRLELVADDATKELMASTVGQLDELSIDRKRTEWRKLWLKARKPSVGLQLAFDIGMFDDELQIFKKLKATHQDKEWHPEGDVWVHTIWVVDEAAKVADREKLDEKSRMMVMLGALCHDLGKPETTSESEGHIHAHGHADEGVKYVERVLTEMGLEGFTRAVEALTKYHMAPPYWFKKQEEANEGALRRLARKMKPATLTILAHVAEADRRGRGPFPNNESLIDMSFPKWFIEVARQFDVHNKPPGDIIRGGDLIKIGYKPGPHFGNVIRAANELFDEHGKTRDEILEALVLTPNVAMAEDYKMIVKRLSE